MLTLHTVFQSICTHQVYSSQQSSGQTDRTLLGDAFYGIQGQTQSPGEFQV